MSRILLATFAAAIAFTSANGQTRVPPNRPAVNLDTTSARPVRDLGAIQTSPAPVDDMKAALRDLVVAQETYFSTHQGYTTDGKALDIFPTRHGQAQTEVTFIGPNTWSGTATEPSLKGKNCVIYVGLVKELPKGAPKTAGGIVAKEEGVPVCDEP